MRRLIPFIMLTFILSISLVSAAPPTSCGNVSSVSLFAPADFTITGTSADNTNFQGLWIEGDTPPLTTECRLEIYAVNGSVNFTGDTISATRSSLTTFPVDKDSFLLFYEEGNYEWNIGCYANISDSCELVYAPNNYSVTFDFSGPNTTLFTPVDNAVFAVNETFNVTYNINDQYDSGTFSCQLYDPVFEYVQSIDNEQNGTFIISQDTAGVYPWYVTCQDTFGNARNSTTRFYIIDDDSPNVTLLTPSNASTIIDNSTVEINYTVADQYDPNPLTCTVYIDGSPVNVSLVTNNTVGRYNYTFSADGEYTLGVTCLDTVGNQGYSDNYTIILDVGASLPVIYNLTNVTTSQSLEIIGYTSKPGIVNVTIANDDFPFQRTNSTNTNSSNFTTFLGSTSITQVYNSSFFRIESTLGGNITAGTFLKFAGHDLLNFMYYSVSTVIPVLDYFRINVTPQMNQTVIATENVEFFDADRPTGWFNVSIELYPGTNNLTVVGSQSGIAGEIYSTEVIYDVAGPTVDTSHLSGIQTNETILFNVSDEYNISLETLIVNITNTSNASDYSIYALSYTNYTGSVDGTINCTNLSLDLRSCYITHGLADGEYNISFSVQDFFGQIGITTLANYTSKTTVLPVALIQDQGQTTSELSLYVNWTATNEAYLDYYQVSVGTALGEDDVVAWFDVTSSETNYTITDNNLEYNDWYFINIRVVDTLGGVSTVTSTNGITIEDNTPPGNAYVEIIPDAGTVWINDNTELDFTWNFTDNESSIVSYEYSLGTDVYPLNGWNNILNSESTTNSSIVEVGLNLDEGETYYLSVKARNSNLFGGNRWSAWYSSAGVTVDTEAPANGYLTYDSQSIDVNYVDVVFLVGEDSVSGISRATLLSRRAALSDGTCSFSGAPDYQEELNATIIGSMTPQNYTFSGLENGYCYRFALDVYDTAGNMVRYGTNQISTISIDTTPPSMVSITDDGFFSSTTNLDFEWTAANDPESGVSYYEYALGTSPGTSDVVNWTNNELLRSISLTSEDYASGHLQDEQVYYLSVRAWNDHNESSFSQTSSDGVLYFDFEIPQALDILSVGNLSGPPYYDMSNESNMTIVLQGESGLSCVWSIYDIDYTDPSSSFADSCIEIGGNNTYYTCEVTNFTQGRYDISVSCADAAGNRQTANSNTDIVIYKDDQLPSISITSPSELVVPAENTIFIATVNETSPYTLTRYIYRTSDSSLLNTLVLNDLENTSVSTSYDFTGLSGEHEVVYVLVDAFNNSVNDTVIIIVNNNQPLATTNLTGSYVLTSQEIGIDVYFFNNFSYTLSNSSGVQLSNEENNGLLQNKTRYNLSIDTSSLSDGIYSLNMLVVSENMSYEKEQQFTIDTIHPQYAIGSFEQNPANPVYEDENLTLYFVWDDQSENITVNFTHNATGVNQSITPENTSMGFVVYQGKTRYVVIIDASSLNTATNFEYRWSAVDEAGNYNSSPAQTVSIENRAPKFEQSSYTGVAGLAGDEFSYLLTFSDEDASQSNASYFDCSINDSNFEATALSDTTCRINWSNPIAGNYSLDVTIHDKKYGQNLSNDTANVLVQVYPATYHHVNITANLPVNLTYYWDSIYSKQVTSYVSEDLNISLPNSENVSLLITTEDLRLYGSNISSNDNGSILIRALNSDLIDDENNDVGVERRYIPDKAYAIEANFTTADSYIINFTDDNFSTNLLARATILKFDYDTLSNEINYSTLEELPNTVTTSTIISARTENFSAFVLVENKDQDGDGYYYDVDCRDDLISVNPAAVEQCSDGLDNNCNGEIDEACTVVSGGSGGGSGGGGFVLRAEPTCDDGIQNAAETGIDCGGNCGVCFEEEFVEPQYCFNSIQDFDEFGVDCGGSCLALCPQELIEPVIQETCFDGIRNQNEEEVDCGGVCSSCIEEIIEPELEEPQVVEEEKGSFAVLFVFIGLLTAGGLIFFVVRSRNVDMFSFGSPQAIAGKITLNSASSIIDDDIASIARYIETQQDKEVATKDIKKHLVKYGYSEKNITAAIDALLQADYLETVQEYLGKYSEEGFNDSELQDWLLEKGIKPHIVAVAMDRHKRDRFKPRNS